MVQDRQLFMETVADGTAADHGELGVDVDRSGTRHEEEPRLEVLQVVDRQRIQALGVDGQDPAREEAAVEREEACGVRERGLDVPPRVADHEGVAVEDLDEPSVHDRLGPGKRRWKWTSSSG